jgi:hypothetical protein
LKVNLPGANYIIYLYYILNCNINLMVQRIQTIYLFIAGMIMFSLFFFTFVEMIEDGTRYYRYDLHGIHEGMGNTARLVESVMPLRFLVFVTGALSLFIIFMYKRRIMQIRLCIFNIILHLGFFALFFFYLYYASRDTEMETYYKIPVVFPLVAIILLYLAIRNIAKDEVLVRSYNRIR